MDHIKIRVDYKILKVKIRKLIHIKQMAEKKQSLLTKFLN